MSERTLGDQVVVLTGSSSGLGSQLARALDCAGATVVLAARRVERVEALARELRSAQAVACDVTSEADRARLVNVTLERYGRIDSLVNNAGVSNVKRALQETTAEFERVLQTNLIAPFALARDVAAHMKEHGGSIVNVASIAGFRATGPLPAAAYTASKAGILGLTRELAVQWGRYGIRVNALAPGFFETEMTAALFAGEAPEWMTAGSPLGRWGSTGELDSALLFLLDPQTSFVTGQTIVVDGGFTAR